MSYDLRRLVDDGQTAIKVIGFGLFGESGSGSLYARNRWPSRHRRCQKDCSLQCGPLKRIGEVVRMAYGQPWLRRESCRRRDDNVKRWFYGWAAVERRFVERRISGQEFLLCVCGTMTTEATRFTDGLQNIPPPYFVRAYHAACTHHLCQRGPIILIS